MAYERESEWSVSAQHHIAIIDDDKAVRSALQRLLRSAHHKAEAYGSGREFLRDLGQHTPDCLVLDMQMPEMSGLQILT
jgi:FixJ family two-component response regulator